MKRTPYLPLARKIRALMSAANMNGVQLAEAAGISRSYPTKILSGEKRPSQENLLKIANALKADLDELTRLAGYSSIPTGDRVALPGWGELEEQDQVQIRSLVGRLAELTMQADADDEGPTARQPDASTGPRRRPDGWAALASIYEEIPPADRAALLRAAQDIRASVLRQSRPETAEPKPLRHPQRRGQA